MSDLQPFVTAQAPKWSAVQAELSAARNDCFAQGLARCFEGRADPTTLELLGKTYEQGPEVSTY